MHYALFDFSTNNCINSDVFEALRKACKKLSVLFPITVELLQFVCILSESCFIVTIFVKHTRIDLILNIENIINIKYLDLTMNNVQQKKKEKNV